jgi:transposase-like protein
MENGKHACPYCKSKGHWFIHTSGKEQVYQCADCMRYFKVKVKENAG